MKIERLTNQKKAILEYLKSTHGHPDAYEVYEFVREKLPQISLATVYRNLDNMSRKGIIRAIRIKDDRYNYDGVEEKHHHFICSRCNRVFNINDDILLNYEKITESGVVELVEDYDLTLRGLCKNCREK